MISYECGESNEWENIPSDQCSSFGMPDQAGEKIIVYCMLGIVLEFKCILIISVFGRIP